MSETKGPQRLGKAAVTLGVSKDTIVEFLSKKGVSVDNNPMAKIEADAYELLLGEFAGDQAAKEKSAATAAKIRESRATITLEDTKKQKGSSKEEEEPEIDYTKFKRKVEVKEKPVAKPEPAPQPEPEQPVAEEAPTKKSTPNKEEEPAPAEEKVNEVKVVGKIDLESIEKPKTKGRKKKEETQEEKPAEQPAAKTKDKAAAQEAPVAPVAQPEPQAPPVKAPEPEKELIRVKVEKLTGVKLMGKIVLPTEAEKKKPDAANSEAEKRKRKRVGKVDIQRQQEIDRRNRNTAKPAEPKKTELSEQDIQNQVKATLARLGGQGKSKSSKFRREKRDYVARRTEEEVARQQAENLVLKLTEFVTVS
jgi:translation initiation factor IF-2